jgi:hypothetical protein
MKRYLTALFTLLSVSALAQKDTSVVTKPTHGVYQHHSIQVALSLGFFDAYRNSLPMPAGFEKNNTSGYGNIEAKIDYALAKRISLAANFGYDAFYYNFSQLYSGYNGIIRRHKINNFRLLNVGLIAYYHLGSYIHIKNLDPFVGAGISLNNIRYGTYPQGDSTLVRTEHTITPYIKVGAHYYISDRFSVFGDLGYEQQAILGIGFSCRFFPSKKEQLVQ